jgi:hypothetical protein
MSQSAAKRRRRQAANGYHHLALLRRPIYRTRDVAKATKRLQLVIQRERERAQRTKKK